MITVAKMKGSCSCCGCYDNDEMYALFISNDEGCGTLITLCDECFEGLRQLLTEIAEEVE